jgi:sporulation protein YlmC with PRC-barrel domain
MVLVVMVLAACGAQDGGTEIPASPPPITADSPDDLPAAATETPAGQVTQEGTAAATDTPGVPVTGNINPARLSNQLDFTVWSQNGEQIGEVDDMVLDLDNARVAYVVVGTGGFLDLGERHILVPWQSLQIQTGSGQTTGGQQNAFILQEDAEVFRNAPDFDLGNLPQAGQPAGDWDANIRTYWESGGTTGGADAPQATEAADMTATATLGADQGTGGNQTRELQGVALATEVLDSTITVRPGEGAGQGQGQPTADPNATADPNGTPTATTGQGAGNIEGAIDDMIVAVDSGEIQYLVVNASLEDGERFIPVPLSVIRWDAADDAFVINANPAALRDAPVFTDGQYPDATANGWNSEFDAFWQNVVTP